ncbi:MAG: CCA tRNA nucleotidyltransferase [Methylacidiphilales bacterium]|nr:CCA tRNA nucleotidyltransferase [Candidatus Methylacidiphilales bacterium]MDW8349103.1 CCA tRNA nucleotidyltransferase [Verrucomicrobiae bacterium]
MDSAHYATAKDIVAKLTQAGFVAYFAGGWVRDYLRGSPHDDIDIATSATPEEIIQLFPKTTGLEGKCFGVVRVLQNHHAYEVATFRSDGDYHDGRHPSSVRFASPQEDAQRRDFTINGLFFDPEKNQVIDFVNGTADLKNKLIRAIGDPLARFREDKLRLLRAVRFATTLGFQIEPSTWQAICHLAPEITRISPERIRDELNKILTSESPVRGLDLLDSSGLLKAILPEIEALKGVQQPPQFHPEGDVYVHTRLMLSHLSRPSLTLALSTLFHDVGKKATYSLDPVGRIRFSGHEHVGARITERVLRRLRYSNEIIETVTACVQNHMTFKDAPQMRLSKLKRLLARPTFDEELDLHRIDCLSSHGDLSIYEFLVQRRQALSQEEISPPRLITGHDLIRLGLSPGPQIGRLLEEIREAQLEGQLSTPEQALDYARNRLRSLSNPTSP